MKEILLFIFFFPLFSSAGDWDLFPLNQKNLYKYPSYNGENVRAEIMDSIKPNGMENVLLFRRNLNYQSAGGCYHNVYNPTTAQGNDFYYMDSLNEINDTVFFYWYYSAQPFYFIPGANAGQSWIITSNYFGNDYNQITITCSGIQQETFLGITDSVKTFTMQPNGISAGQIPVNNFVMKLSQHHGLIEFVPFSLFISHPSSMDFFSMRLIGIDSASITYGYQQPTLQEYFHLSVGDVLLWERSVNPDNIMQPDWQEFYRDTITQVFSSADSVIYYYDRTKLDSDQVITQHNGQSIAFHKNHYNDLMSAPPRWLAPQTNTGLPWVLGLSFNITVWQSESLLLKTDSLTSDTISEFSFTTDDLGLDTSTCQLPSITDIGHDFSMNTRMGITSYCLYFFGLDCVTLTGAVINGLHYGNADLPTGINSFSDKTELSISPNPFQDFAKIKIKNFKSKNLELKIYNTIGALVRFEKATVSNMQEIKIERGDLVDGLYFYRLTNNEFSASGKFVIE